MIAKNQRLVGHKQFFLKEGKIMEEIGQLKLKSKG
jgi:hypothetical protein